MTRVLVAGGGGFIGRATTAGLIRAGLEVAVLDNFCSSSRDRVPAGARILETDLCDRSRVLQLVGEFKPSHVVHAVGFVPPTLVDHRLLTKTATVNAISGLNLVEAMMESGCRRLIYTSTAAVYGEVPTSEFADENFHLRPINPYGASKAAFEVLLEPWIQTGDLEVVIFRYSNVYGPGQEFGQNSGVVTLAFKHLLDGKSLTIYGRDEAGDGGCRRDYVAIDDVVAANMLAVSSNMRGTFNVSSQQGHSTVEVLEFIAGLLRVEPKWTGAAPRPGEIKSSAQDNRRLRAAGWGPPMPLSEGLRKYCKEYCELYV